MHVYEPWIHMWSLFCTVLFCSTKCTQLAEGLGGTAAMHSSILQFGLIYSSKQKIWETTDYNGFLEAHNGSIHAEDMPGALAHAEGKGSCPKLMTASNRPTPLICGSETHEEIETLSRISWTSPSAPNIPSPPHPAWRSPLRWMSQFPGQICPSPCRAATLTAATSHHHIRGLGLAPLQTHCFKFSFIFAISILLVLISLSSHLSPVHIISCFIKMQNRKYKHLVIVISCPDDLPP